VAETWRAGRGGVAGRAGDLLSLPGLGATALDHGKVGAGNG
jgi:hypothetical protein